MMKVKRRVEIWEGDSIRVAQHENSFNTTEAGAFAFFEAAQYMFLGAAAEAKQARREAIDAAQVASLREELGEGGA